MWIGASGTDRGPVILRIALQSLFSRQRRGYSPFLRAIVVVVVTIVLLAGAIMLFEDRFIYFPSKYPEGLWERPERHVREGEIFPLIEDVYLTASDGIRIHGWFCTPQQRLNGEDKPLTAEMTLLYFHGNAGNISYRYEFIRKLMTIPVSVFIIDYRGYGKSEGTPSEEGFYRDAQAAWDYLVNSRGLKASQIIIFGKSLGGAVGIDLATKIDPAGVIIQSSFTSIADMAKRVMPLVPGFLIRTKMNSVEKIRRVRTPKLFIHSPVDEVVPYELGRRLYDEAIEPKQFYEVADSSHNETDLTGGAAYMEALRRFINENSPAASQ